MTIVHKLSLHLLSTSDIVLFTRITVYLGARACNLATHPTRRMEGNISRAPENGEIGLTHDQRDSSIVTCGGDTLRTCDGVCVCVRAHITTARIQKAHTADQSNGGATCCALAAYRIEFNPYGSIVCRMHRS